MEPRDIKQAIALGINGLNRGTWLPTRVMIDEFEGRRPVAGTTLDVVFFRDDGWTLGAPAALAAAAQRTWKNQWVAVARRTTEQGWVLQSLDGQPYDVGPLPLKLTTKDLEFIVHCLRICRERFVCDAGVSGEAQALPRLQEQFNDQARQALELIDRIENRSDDA